MEKRLIHMNGEPNALKGARSVRRGVHVASSNGRPVPTLLVVATQRPDTRALDSQVKANLTGVICFQMMNDASSISVLGNGRASDLPRVPGRAIWKNGMDMLEVQTPFLDAEAAEALLGPADNIEEAKKEEQSATKLDQTTIIRKTKEDYRSPKD